MADFFISRPQNQKSGGAARAWQLRSETSENRMVQKDVAIYFIISFQTKLAKVKSGMDTVIYSRVKHGDAATLRLNIPALRP